MKKSIFYFLLVIKIAFYSSQTINVSVSTSSTYNVPDDFFSAVTMNSVGNFDYTDPAFKKLVDSCGIKNLYYPGGSCARFAHYSPGIQGYGIDLNQAYSISSIYGNNVATSDWYADQLNANNNFLEECLGMCQSLHQGIIICANVMTGYLSDLSNIMAACNSYSVSVKSVIFNTEVHNQADRGIFPGAKAYLDSISKYTQFLQQNYPNVPIVVDAAPLDAPGTSGTFYRQWNDSVSNPAITGITMPRGGINWWWDPPFTNTISATNTDAIFSYEKAGMLNYFNVELPTMVDSMNNYFSQMDVVQLGIKTVGSNYTQQLENTLLSELFFMKRIFWMINYNASNNPTNPFFKTASIMKLASAQEIDPIYHLNAAPTVYKTSTTFDSYVLMKKIQGGTYVKPNVTGLAIASDLTSYYFRKGNLNWVYFVNMDSTSKTVNSISVNGVSQSSYTVMSVYGQNNKLYAKNADPNYPIIKTTLNNQNSVAIPPHSIVIVQLQNLALPTASFNVLTSVCVGQTVSLNDLSSGVTSRNWTMTGASPTTSTLQNTTVSFLSAGIYSITLVVYNINGNSVPLTKTISVIGSPTLSISGNTVICSGHSTTLTASGANNYTWTPSIGIGTTTFTAISVIPSSTTVYTLTGSNGSCTNTANKTVSVNPSPTVNATASGSVICSGQIVTLTGSGAVSYTFNPGNINNNPATYTPTTTTSYTITGGNSANCKDKAYITLTVSTCTDIYELKKSRPVSVYPNPANDILTISLKDENSIDAEFVVVLVDVADKEVLRKTYSTPDFSIDVKQFSEGMYILKVRTDKREYIQKVVVQK